MIDLQQLAAIGLIALPAMLLVYGATRVDWAKIRKQLPDVTPEPEVLTEADYLPGDYDALQRLKARAERYSNADMWGALETVESQFMTTGEGWESA